MLDALRCARCLLLLCLALACAGAAWGADATPVVVDAPYAELHTGPADDFPIFYVVTRGETMLVLKKRTAWFKVRSATGKEGWVSAAQMQSAHFISGERFDVREASRDEYARRSFETGLLAGELDGARVLTFYSGYLFTPNLAAEISLSDAMGSYSRSWSAQADIVAQPFPHWRVAPFFALGGGTIHTEPRAALVQTRNRDDTLAHAGIGVRIYAGARFLFRAEYRSQVVFTSNDDNEELDEWKAGFAFFF